MTTLIMLFFPSVYLFCAFSTVLSQQLMIMEMFIVSLVCRSLYRRRYDVLPSEEDDNEQNEKEALQTALQEHDV